MRWFEILGTAALAVYTAYVRMRLSECNADFNFFKAVSARSALLLEHNTRRIMEQDGISYCLSAFALPSIVELTHMSTDETIAAYDTWFAAAVEAGKACNGFGNF